MPGVDRLWAVGFVTLLVAVMAGCGAGTSKSGVSATPITMTNANGVTAPASVLSLGSSLSLSMKPSNDVNGLGVDWTVACGGNPTTGSVTNGACGTLAPAHTQDGGATLYTAPSQVPIYNTVTITATLTGDRSQSSSVSFTIVSSPIGVAFSSTSSRPASMTTNTTVNFTPQITNDLSGSGVFWIATCGSSVCGSFNPTSPAGAAITLPGYSTTYTAPSVVPAGGTVTITATSVVDTTKFTSTTVLITVPPPPVPVTVSVSPSNVYLETSGSTHSVSLTSVVANDPAGAGVDWTLSCSVSNCGTLNGSTKAHTQSGAAVSYVGASNASPGQTITITAKSTTNPAISASVTATIVSTLPIVVAISSGPPTTLIAASQVTLVAKATNDTANLGVDWSASCGSASACGSFNPAHTSSGGQTTYTAPAAVPAGGLVTITASAAATTPSNSAVAFTTILPQPPSLTFTQTLPVSMESTAKAPVSVTVANDVAPGGVTWSVQCNSTTPGGCGWISPVQTASGETAIYTAPPVTSSGTAVTVTATSVAKPSVSINTPNPILIKPSIVPSVNFVPSLPAQIQPDATVNLTATVANDGTNAGVDWQVCASGCGFFTVKPAVAAIPATATTPYVPAVPPVTSTTTNTQLSPYWPNGWPNGLSISYTAPSQVPASGIVAIVALAHVDTTKANSGTIAITMSLTGPALSGVVQAGPQPVAGASVFLYTAGTSGYASASSQIASTTTDTNGNFTVPAGYTCASPTSQAYLVATGGKAGSNTNANPNFSLMTALGSCNALGSSAIVVNEITTIASTWALAQFAANDELTGNSSYLYLGTSSGNLSGLANAFAAVNNLVDITTGQARFRTPADNAAVPYMNINTMADFLNACTATSGGVEGDGSPCSILFIAADTLGGTGAFSGSIAPSDTLQAAFNIAQQPTPTIVGDPGGVGNGNDYELDRGGNLFALATTASPFQPIFTTNPTQCNIALNYTSGGGLTDTSTVGSFAIDTSGNLWITDTTGASVIEWNAVGAALSPATGFPAGGGPLAIDANGDVWVSGNGVLNELTSLGTPFPGSPYVGVAGGGSDMAFDAQDNLWIASSTGVNEFNNFGVELSPASGFNNGGMITNVIAVGVDSSNNVWVGAEGNPAANVPGALAELTNPGGALIVNSQQGGLTAFLPQFAADGSGNMWGVSGSTSPGSDNSVCKVPPYGGLGTILVPTCYIGGLPDPIDIGYTPIGANAQGLAFDGAGGLWIAGSTLLDALGNYSGAGISIPIPNALPLRVAIDGSGNVWVLLSNNTVLEHVGAATPVVAPIALGVKNKKLAAKP